MKNLQNHSFVNHYPGKESTLRFWIFHELLRFLITRERANARERVADTPRRPRKPLQSIPSVCAEFSGKKPQKIAKIMKNLRNQPKLVVLKIAVSSCVRPVGWRPNPAGPDQRTAFFSHLYIMISPFFFIFKNSKSIFFLSLQRFSHSGLGDARKVHFLGT